MNKRFEIRLDELKVSGNYRTINCSGESSGMIDLTSNDYLGIAENNSLKEDFFAHYDIADFTMSSSASRLLSKHQKEYFELESFLENQYNKPALLFNSGYHANLGIISTICDKETLIIADRLVHASIIDGIMLSKAPFLRFRHNDYDHLETIIKKEINNYSTILVISESIYSMDGDCCDLHQLVSIKNRYSNIILYVDEAHAVGVVGCKGLGLAEREDLIDDIDILVGTFGKAIGSIGAFVVTSSTIKNYIINHTRSFIFSTSIPPFSALWTKFVFEKILQMTQEREHLRNISQKLCDFINPLNKGIESNTQIIPLIIGNSKRTIEFSTQLNKLGYSALPIRTPTVPKGTERIRFSLSSNLSDSVVTNLINDLSTLL